MSAVTHLSFEEKAIIVSAKLYFYGSCATDDPARKIVEKISVQFNGANGKITIDDIIFDVKFDAGKFGGTLKPIYRKVN